MIKQSLEFITRLQFLSANARAHIFGTGTRLWEYASAALTFGIGMLLLVDRGQMFQHIAVYRAFLDYGRGYADEVLGVLMLVCCICISLGLAFQRSYRAICLGRWGMAALGLIWAVIGAAFWRVAPSSMAVVVYSVLSVCCWLVAEHLGDVADLLEGSDVRNRN